MFRRPWHELIGFGLAAHLVVALVRAPSGARAARLIDRLITAIRPSGRYALTINHEAFGPVVHCAFEEEADADALAGLVNAGSIHRYKGWKSQRQFRFDSRAQELIASFLAVKVRARSRGSAGS